MKQKTQNKQTKEDEEKKTNEKIGKIVDFSKKKNLSKFSICNKSKKINDDDNNKWQTLCNIFSSIFLSLLLKSPFTFCISFPELNTNKKQQHRHHNASKSLYQ